MKEKKEGNATPMPTEQTTPEKESMYRRIDELFKAYRGHIFQPFEKVLVYYRDRGSQGRFTIVPHVVWYFDEEEGKHVLYDPTVRFTASNLIPFEGNEEFIGFHGNTEEIRKYKSAER